MARKVTLVCSICLSRNYHTTKTTNEKDRLVLTKYCKKCNAHTEHKQTK